VNLVNPRTRREFVRFTKFSVVGTIGAVVDFGTFNLLAGGLGISSVLSSVVSFVAAVTSNFLWNRYWTYPDSRSKFVRHQALQFAAVNLVGLAIRTPIFVIAEAPATELAAHLMKLAGTSGFLSQFQLAPAALGRNLALALAVLVVLLWNFGVNRIWTYSDAK
jgi:putative flippase GtrA